MAFWQRLLVTLLAMLVVSFVVGQVWEGIFGARLPDYVAGVVGGLTALPVWEFLRRVGPRGGSGA